MAGIEHRKRGGPFTPTTLAVAALILAAAGLVALYKAGWPSRSRTVGIGFATLGPRTGDDPSLQAVRLAVLKLNEEGRGRGLTFVVRTPSDPRGDPVRAAAQLRADPQVAAVVGSAWSQDLLDAAAEYGELDREALPPVAVIGPIASNMDLSGLSPWVFRLCPTDGQQAILAAHFAFDSLGARRAAILYQNDAYGIDWSRAFRDEFTRLGAAVIARDPFSTDTADLPLYGQYVRQLGADLIVMPALDGSQGAVLGMLDAYARRTPVLAGDAGWAVGINRPDLDLSRYYFTAIYMRDEGRTPESRWFVTEFERQNPTIRALQRVALTYDAALAIGRAVLEVGSSRARVRDFLASLGTGRPPIEGATGIIAFDERHDGTKRFMRVVKVRP